MQAWCKQASTTQKRADECKLGASKLTTRPPTSASKLTHHLPRAALRFISFVCGVCVAGVEFMCECAYIHAYFVCVCVCTVEDIILLTSYDEGGVGSAEL